MSAASSSRPRQAPRASFYIGSDIGGTFTDTVILGEDGSIRIWKSPTTPDNLSRGAVNGLNLASEELGASPDRIGEALAYFAHGTTAATNAFIERKGVRTGLIATRGFGDVLRIQRSMGTWAGMGHKVSHYSARTSPEPIIPPELVREVDERVDYKGAVVVPLDENKLRDSILELVAEGVEAIAVAFLWSFRNPEHERRAGRIIAEEARDVFVTLSSDLVPVLGEYERTSTTAINAYLGPIIARYVTGLEQELRGRGFRGELAIMDSSGGVLPSEDAAVQAVAMLTSGPAGGVLASTALAQQLGYRNVIASDMGGTSFDVGLIVDGMPVVARGGEVGRFHVALPTINVTAIGSGGGSIARVRDGHLTVGPESAGAVPGPACYGRGGEEPTITDADVVLGIIDPEFFLGGRMRLDPELARRAIQRYVAEPLGMDVVEAAAGIRTVADNQMADLLRKVTLRAGYDPREFVLFAYGGAGPTHAYRYAAEAGISTVVVPVTATAHSAYGAVTSDRHRSFALADHQHAPPGFKQASAHVDVRRLNAGFAQLEARCRAALGSEGLDMRRYLGMRFRQQVHELQIEVPLCQLEPEDVDGLVDAFELAYENLFGKDTALRIAGVEFTVLRVDGRVPVPKPVPVPVDGQEITPAPSGLREVFWYEVGRSLPVEVYRSEDVYGGASLAGPAIIEHPGTTIVVGPGQSARVDGYGHTTIELQPGVAA